MYLGMLTLSKELATMNNLAYIYKLWISVVKASGKLTTSDVLLASKRLVEGQTNQDIKISIKKFDENIKNLTLQETLTNLNTMQSTQKYIILINLFMLQIVDSNKVAIAQEETLKNIFLQLKLPFLYEIFYLLLNKKYNKAHKLLKEYAPNMHFICFDEDSKNEVNQSFKSYQVSFIVLKIDDSFLLLNNHSHDLNIYSFTNTKQLSLSDKCEKFKVAPYLFSKHNIRNHSIYYLNSNIFIRILNKKEVIYIDENALFELFTSQQDSSYLLSEIFDVLPDGPQCSLVKDHIYHIEATSLYAGYTKSKPIDKDVNFDINEGELVAIMGPSGSGKTTLLRTFVQQTKILSGELLINDEKISKKFLNRIGYVEQDDVLIKDLNVYDNMYYYYRLHFGKKESDETIDKLITNQLRDLGILDIKYSSVFKKGKYTISGGQRKRLNIALELLKDIDLILMDEPTSGLSSLDSENIIRELKRITNLRKIIIINIHQPSSAMYNQFDKVIVFNEEGHNIYTNSAKEVLKIFKLIKTEDTLMFNNTEETIEDSACIKCAKSDPELLLEIQADEKSNFWNLFRYLNTFTDN